MANHCQQEESCGERVTKHRVQALSSAYRLTQGEEVGPRRSGGSSSEYTEGRGDPSPRPPSSGRPAARGRSGYSHSGRRVTYASHPDFGAILLLICNPMLSKEKRSSIAA